MGTDVHARDRGVKTQLDRAIPEKPVRLDAGELVALVAAVHKASLKVYTCQEADPCAFGLRRRLLAAWVQSLSSSRAHCDQDCPRGSRPSRKSCAQPS